jgi:hypothetical protein
MSVSLELIDEYINGSKQMNWIHINYYKTSKNTVEQVTIGDIIEINPELEQGWPAYIKYTKGENIEHSIFLITYLELKTNGLSDKYIYDLEYCIDRNTLFKTKKILQYYSKFSDWTRQRILCAFKPDEIKDLLLKEKYAFIKGKIPVEYLDILQTHPKFKELVNYYGAFDKYPQYLDAQKVAKNEKQIIALLNNKTVFELIKKKVDWNQTLKGKIPLFIGYLNNKTDSDIIEFICKNTDYNLLITKSCNERTKNAITMLQHLAHPERYKVLECMMIVHFQGN